MSKPEKIVAIKGMNDILPSDAPLWELFENTTETILKSYGYQKIVTPIVEQTSLFSRAIGAVTDIVEKEMYSFEDSMNGDQLTLRPEGTASVVRAVLEHNLVYDGPRRLWYKGPMFRHERPQRGRYRQFFQFGAEAIGFSGPDIDPELIMMCRRLWDDLGIENVRLELNSIGNAEERQRHRADLIAYLEQREKSTLVHHILVGETVDGVELVLGKTTRDSEFEASFNATAQVVDGRVRRLLICRTPELAFD